jgi:hypothetical protein
MATVVQESKTFGQFLPTGTTPTTADMNNTWSNAVGGVSSYSSLFLRTDIELYVLAGGGTTDVDLAFAHETLIVVGGILTVGSSVATSPTPLTDANISPFTGQLHGWGQWNYLTPTIDFVNVNIPQTVLVTWRPEGGTIATEFKRRSDTIAGMDLWMPWEIQDGAGLINTTDAGGNTYYLGARFAQSWFWEYRT